MKPNKEPQIVINDRYMLLFNVVATRLIGSSIELHGNVANNTELYVTPSAEATARKLFVIKNSGALTCKKFITTYNLQPGVYIGKLVGENIWRFSIVQR